jgi:hypothetical protein
MIKYLLLSVVALTLATMLGGCSDKDSRPNLNLFVCESLVSSADQPGEVEIISVVCPPDAPRESGR